MIIDRFVTVLADTQVARDAHYRVRYQVFCEETGFEDPDRFPDQREMDYYDATADHFLIWDRLDECWVGAMRLIDASRTRLPLEAVCEFPLEGLDANRLSSVEFSRLCILNEYRHIPTSIATHATPSASASAAGREQASLRQIRNEVFLRLLYATLGRGINQGLSYCYGIITAPLARILGRMGIPLQRVGGEVLHRGTRIPHRYDIGEAMNGMISKLPEFAAMVANSPAYVPHSELTAELSATSSLPTLELRSRRSLDGPGYSTGGHHKVRGQLHLSEQHT